MVVRVEDFLPIFSLDPTGALYPGKTEGPKGGKEDHANDEGKDHPEAEKKDEAGTR